MSKTGELYIDKLNEQARLMDYHMAMALSFENTLSNPFIDPEERKRIQYQVARHLDEALEAEKLLAERAPKEVK